MDGRVDASVLKRAGISHSTLRRALPQTFPFG
jgi:hypothetical protein